MVVIIKGGCRGCDAQGSVRCKQGQRLKAVPPCFNSPGCWFIEQGDGSENKTLCEPATRIQFIHHESARSIRSVTNSRGTPKSWWRVEINGSRAARIRLNAGTCSPAPCLSQLLVWFQRTQDIQHGFTPCYRTVVQISLPVQVPVPEYLHRFQYLVQHNPDDSFLILAERLENIIRRIHSSGGRPIPIRLAENPGCPTSE